MARAMGELHMKECMTFVDDVIVHSNGFEQGLERLEHVFRKLRQNNLKLNPAKCEFFKTRVKYCGHIVSEKGVETDPDKIAKVAEWPTPTSVEAVREFLGFTGYYRRFVKDYAKIARPLTDLLIGNSTKKKNTVQKQPTPEWKWGDDQQTAFEKLRSSLVSPPILAYADYDRPFILHTDASRDGLGAVLCQECEGKEHVVAYASRGLTKSEKNYPVHKQELLALKWAI